MTSAILHRLLAGSMLATSLLASSRAWAQEVAPDASDEMALEEAPAVDAPGTTGEIVITARRRSERLIDVPETITAFSEATLEQAGIRNIDDLGQALPNVVLNRRGDNEPNVVIRGVGSFGNVQGVGFYIDDVPNFTDQAGRIVDLARIEVLKGPQGTLYGGSSIGGAVKYVTRKPSQTFEGKAAVELGSFDTRNAHASVNIPLSGVAAFRVSGYADTSNGYVRNNVTGINNDRSREYGIRAALRFTPSADTDINLSVRYSDLDNGGNDYYLTTNDSSYSRRSDLDRNIFNRRKVFGGILSAEQQFGDLSFTSLTSYTQRRNRILFDLDYSSLDGLAIEQPTPIKTKVFTQELRLQSDDSEGFSWLIGGFYSRVRDRNLTIRGDAVFGVDFGGPFTLTNFSDNTSLEQTYAGFGSLTYESGPFEATLGGRLNYTNFYGLNRNLPDSLHVKDTVILPKLTLSYKVDPAIMLYFNAAEGYEPGRFTLFSDTPLIPYKPERATNFELGAKGETAGGLLFYEVAAFYIKSRDRQLETLVVDPSGVPTEAIGNVGDARTLGAEFCAACSSADAEHQWRVDGFKLHGGPVRRISSSLCAPLLG